MIEDDQMLVRMSEIEPFLRYFRFSHLPDAMAERSAAFSVLAMEVVRGMVEESRDPRETQACLRKLLEAKDCAVRAMLP